jgi:hypothetical protein
MSVSGDDGPAPKKPKLTPQASPSPQEIKAELLRHIHIVSDKNYWGYCSDIQRSSTSFRLSVLPADPQTVCLHPPFTGSDDRSQSSVLFKEFKLDVDFGLLVKMVFYAKSSGFTVMIKTADGFLGGKFCSCTDHFLHGPGKGFHLKFPNERKELHDVIYQALGKMYSETDLSLKSQEVLRLAPKIFYLLNSSSGDHSELLKVIKKVTCAASALEVMDYKFDDARYKTMHHARDMLEEIAALTLRTAKRAELIKKFEDGGLTSKALFTCLVYCQDEPLLPFRTSKTKYLGVAGNHLQAVKLSTLSDQDSVFCVSAPISTTALRNVKGDSLVFTEAIYHGVAKKGDKGVLTRSKDPMKGELSNASFFLQLSKINVPAKLPEPEVAEAPDADAGSKADEQVPIKLGPNLF